MTYDPDATRARLMRLKELARYATPQERAQLLKALRLIIKTYGAIAELREEMQREVRALRQHNRITALYRQMEAAARRGRVCISDDNIPE